MSTNKKRTSGPAKKVTRRSTTRKRSAVSVNEDGLKTESCHGQITGATIEEGGGTDRENPKISMVNSVMEQFAAQTVAKKIEGLKAEFATLSTFTPADPAATAFQSHKDKNRYTNIPCYDKTRVVLKLNVPPDTDYIHANSVDTQIVKLSNRYICAQAPLNSTINDWWRLIWQEKIKHIIMLCKLIENGKSKCAEYWPAVVGETKQYGTVSVQHVKAANNGGEKTYESTLLKVSVGTEQLNITLHRWAEWPDFGVPTSGMGILRLLRSIRSDAGATTLVHCSAGVGRTGTVMAIELGLRAMLEGKEVNVLEIVKELRSHRACSVQTEGQFVFIHRCLIEFVKAKKLAKTDVAEFATQYTRYKDGQNIQKPQSHYGEMKN